MPNKRSRRKNEQKFSCPCCQSRLWRLGSPKYYIFHQGKEDFEKTLNLSDKKACFLAEQNSSVVNHDVWIEEFFCEKDGIIWMYLERSSTGKLEARLATPKDWQRTTKIPNPELPNSTVSEFRQRMSRNYCSSFS